jgi:dihydropteroate synthase
MSDRPSSVPHLHFVTGRLAAQALRWKVAEIANQIGFQYSIGVMPITVAALITPHWLRRHLDVPEGTSEVILPGYIGDDIDVLRDTTEAVIRVGPKDLRDLAEFLGGEKSLPPDLSQHRIEIIAEINHAPRMTIAEIVDVANALRDDGADRIDVGCQPGQPWSQIGDAVSALVADGHRVSVDSFDPEEVAKACRAGASLVLSVNNENVLRAQQWETEVVAIPDTPDDLDSLDRTIEQLERMKVRYRLDPILEPIGMGLANSLVRYHRVRSQYPDAPMMMGIGNLTELTDVDSAGINMLLLGICAELRIDSVLTTQVIPWARTAVRECDRARRIVDFAVRNQVPPKKVDTALVMLRDPKIRDYPPDWFDALAAEVRDNNYRLFAQADRLHLVSAGLHLQDRDPFRLFDSLLAMPQSRNVDVSHAFYLGYELAKANIALTLGKQYDQDQSLRWGHLTIPEDLHRLRRGRRASGDRGQESSNRP